MFLHNNDVVLERLCDRFDSLKPVVDIPVEDVSAYKMYPKHRWVYDKLRLCESLGIEAWPHGITPTEYPVFSKPICNLYGTSIGARILTSSDNLYLAGHFLMPVLKGKQVSTDYALIDGEVVWSFSMAPQKDSLGSFISWHSTKIKQMHELQWIQKHMKGYTGMINIESIGSAIIEIHLRFSLEFIDVYPEEFKTSLIELYEHSKWTSFHDSGGHCYVVRIPKDVDGNQIIQHNFSSTPTVKIHYTIQENQPLNYHVDNDVSSYRIALVFGKDKVSCKTVADELKQEVLAQISSMGI